MIANVFFAVLGFVALSFVLCAIGCIVTALLQGYAESVRLFEYWVFRFNGLLVGGFGWAMAWFVARESKGILNKLLKLIEIPEDLSPSVLRYFSKTISLKWILAIGTAIASVGAATLFLSGYPLSGFAGWYLAVWSASMHFTGAYLLMHLLFSIQFFRHLDSISHKIGINRTQSSLERSSLNTYFVLTATLGIVGLYFAFRGTLTAGFTFPEPLFEKLLIYPVLVYLPVGLMYSFYPRFVLKRIYDMDSLRRLQELDRVRESVKEDPSFELDHRLQMQTHISQLQENLREETRQFPVLSTKDYPSLFLVFLMLLQFAIHEDNVIVDFLKQFTQ